MNRPSITRSPAFAFTNAAILDGVKQHGR